MWSYGYDQNSNVISEVTPCSGTTCEAFTTTIAYDALDRVSSKYLARRDLSAADVALFGADHEDFDYDLLSNSVGRLSIWKTFGEAGSTGTPVLKSEHQYTAQGQSAFELQTLNATSYTNLQRSTYSRYSVSGALLDTFFGDVVGSQNCQNGSYAYFFYDARGLPMQVQEQNCVYGPSDYSYMTNARNVAGLVTKRYSQAGSGPISYAESNWTYDKLGRVTSHIVNKGNPLAQVVRQDRRTVACDDRNPGTTTSEGQAMKEPRSSLGI